MEQGQMPGQLCLDFSSVDVLHVRFPWKKPRMMQSVWPKAVGQDTVAMEDVWDGESTDI